MSISNLNAEDWRILENVAEAAFANPFGKTRDDLDLKVGGASRGAKPEEVLAAMLSRVDGYVGRLKDAGLADINRHKDSRRETLKVVLLFHVFHRHMERWDRHIAEQEARGGVPVKVPFAGEVLAELKGYGFDEAQSLRYFAFFFQLKRAYYFIRQRLVGSSPCMVTLRKHLWNCVFTGDARRFEEKFWNRMEDFSVLLLGETGTGKSAAAAAIGKSGFIPFDPARGCFTESFMGNFVSINLSQFSEGLIESELFGHKRGAFTGAVEEHEGIFARCAPHGVIFIDEIGDVSPQIQTKLLMVLQERKYYPVGSHTPKSFSGRVLAATHRKLDELRRDGAFRDDLYYRLCSDVVAIPPLRERIAEDPGELDVLLASILRRIAGEADPGEVSGIKEALLRGAGPAYGWPGNVRELEQAVKRIILTGSYQPQAKPHKEGFAERLEGGLLTAEEVLAGYCGLLYGRFGSYEEVSRRTGLDRRTVKKYVVMAGQGRD